MKKILNLQKIINLRGTVEKLISSTQIDIIKNNPVLKDGKIEEDVSTLYKKYNALLDQLIVIKLAQEKGNRKRSKLNGLTNQELILELSNLDKKKKPLLESMYNAKLKTDKYKFQISKSEIDDDLTTVKERISEIKKSMTEFNTSTTVKVVIFEELNLL